MDFCSRHITDFLVPEWDQSSICCDFLDVGGISAGDLLQEAIAIANVKRPGRGEHGVEFVVGELEG